MKTRLQFTPALTAAILCALAWFALWLTAFRPIPEPAVETPRRTAAAVCPATDDPLRAPSLFALPAKEGFSGTFPEKQVYVEIDLERPRQPETYLSRQPTASAAPDQTELIESIPLPHSDLPLPEGTRTKVIRRPGPIALFFSPELQPRAQTTSLAGVEPLPVASVRIHLTVRPDGTVAHAFFETPMEQPALLSAVRKLRFRPASVQTDGWLDIRFTPPKEKPGETI